MTRSKKYTIDEVVQEARDSWGGATGEERADRVKGVIDRVCREYSVALNMTEEEVFEVIESNRSYFCCNYYQDAKFPNLKDVKIYKDLEEFKVDVVEPKFICPHCKGISSNPYECNSGIIMSEKKPCDWKSYGFFGTLGKGFSYLLVDKFRQGEFAMETIFMPYHLNRKEQDGGE